MRRAAVNIGLVVLISTGCGIAPGTHEVELSTPRLTEAEAGAWSLPAVESGHPEIRVRGVFVAQVASSVTDTLVPTHVGSSRAG